MKWNENHVFEILTIRYEKKLLKCQRKRWNLEVWKEAIIHSDFGMRFINVPRPHKLSCQDEDDVKKLLDILVEGPSTMPKLQL